MSNRGRAAQISFDWVLPLDTEAALEAFPALLPHLDIRPFEIVEAKHSEEAAARGVQLIQGAKGKVLMNGGLHTDELVRSMTSKSSGPRTARRIRCPHRAADLYPGKRRRRLCRLGR